MVEIGLTVKIWWGGEWPSPSNPTVLISFTKIQHDETGRILYSLAMRSVHGIRAPKVGYYPKIPAHRIKHKGKPLHDRERVVRQFQRTLDV